MTIMAAPDSDQILAPFDLIYRRGLARLLALFALGALECEDSQEYKSRAENSVRNDLISHIISSSFLMRWRNMD
jgi:hypothetical protein